MSKKAVALLLLCASLAAAQTPQPTPPFTATQVFDAWIADTEKQVVSAAAAMPDDKFSFAPTSGEFHGVRTFAGQIKHLAANNFQVGAMILGQKPPHGEHGEEAPDSVRTKEEVLDYLKSSFAYLHQAAASINEKTIIETLPGTKGVWQRTRFGLAIDAISHSFDHYGQMVEYLRMNGVVPPASR